MRIWHVCLVYRGCLSYNCHKNVDELTGGVGTGPVSVLAA